LKIPRVLPFIVGLIVLAFALGSLPRGTPGGSLLFRSYWLLYLLYLGPVVALGAMIAVIILIALNYRDIGGAIGFKMAQKRKRSSRYANLLKMFLWVFFIGVLIEYKGSIFNPTHAVNSTIAKNITGEDATTSNPFQSGSFLPALSNLIQNPWFSLAFLGLLVVGGVILVEGFRVSLRETRDSRIQELQANQEHGLEAVLGAIRLVEDPGSDPRSRIIACYQHLITTASSLGVPVSSDLTARELDSAMRSTFALKGPATSELTQLFEEARYSLHEIRESDAQKAHEYLQSVAEELKIQLKSET